MMVSTVDSKVFSEAVAVTRQFSPTVTSPMSYSSTRKVATMCSKSAIWIRVSPASTSSSFSTLTWFTVPSKSAVKMLPLLSRISRSPFFTRSPLAT